MQWIRGQPEGFFKKSTGYEYKKVQAHAAYGRLNKEDTRQGIAEFVRLPQGPAREVAAP